MILGSHSGTRGEGEGSGGGGGSDDQIESKSKPSYLEEEEEDEEKEDMANQNMEWMIQGPLALIGSLQKVLKHSKRMIIKFYPNNIVKAEDHLDKFYL